MGNVPSEPEPRRSSIAQVEPMAAQAKTFTMEEVKKHNTRNDCWLAIHGKVYDVTYVRGIF